MEGISGPIFLVQTIGERILDASGGFRWKKMEIGGRFWRMAARGKFSKDYYLEFELGMSLHASEPFPVNPGARTNFPGHFPAASREDLRGGARGNAIHAGNDPPCPGLCI